MTEKPAPDISSSGPPQSGWSQANTVMIVYVLYLVEFAAPITAIIGVVFAYMNREPAQGTWTESHFEFQIRTFWIGLAMIVVGAVLAVFVIGIFLLMFWFVWTVIRSARGLMWQSRGEPVPDPMTLLW